MCVAIQTPATSTELDADSSVCAAHARVAIYPSHWQHDRSAKGLVFTDHYPWRDPDQRLLVRFQTIQYACLFCSMESADHSYASSNCRLTHRSRCFTRCSQDSGWSTIFLHQSGILVRSLSSQCCMHCSVWKDCTK